jgi:hypothetical protein
MEKIDAKLKNILESKIFIRTFFGVGIIIIVILIFAFGVAVGIHKASFGRAWGEHYYENFGMPQHGMLGILDVDDFPNAHGAVGEIIKIESPNIIVQDKKDNLEKVISINGTTKIQKGSDNIVSTDLKIDDFVIVIGIPDDKGIIISRLIRVIPNPESLQIEE